MALPEFQVAEDLNPRKLFLFSHTKVGKTTLLSGLENCLIVDTENGSGFIDGVKFNAIKEALAQNVLPTKVLKGLADEIKASGVKYDYIALDTITAIEDMARGMATWLYQHSNVGKDFKGTDVVAELSNGAGYDWLRKAFKIIYDWFAPLASKALIITGHVKTASITKNGKELGAKDIQLTGKLKHIVCADADAIGYLFRKDNQVIVSFKTHEQDLATGARSPHLRNQEFCLSELNDGVFQFYWDKIFLTNNTDK